MFPLYCSQSTNSCQHYKNVQFCHKNAKMCSLCAVVSYQIFCNATNNINGLRFSKPRINMTLVYEKIQVNIQCKEHFEIWSHGQQNKDYSLLRYTAMYFGTQSPMFCCKLLHTSSRRWHRWQVPWKHWYLATKLKRIISQKTIIWRKYTRLSN